MRAIVSRFIDGWVARARVPVELRCATDGWEARLTSQLDGESEAFEAELLARELPTADLEGPAPGVELPLFQRHDWIRGSPREHRLFQLRDPDGKAAVQIALRIERPRRVPMLARAIAHKMGTAASVEAAHAALGALDRLAREAGDIVSIRLQPYRRRIEALRDLEGLARRAGYRLIEPVGVTRTLLVDLAPTLDEMLVAVTKKTRAKLKHKGRDAVIIRSLDGAGWAPACVAATNESMARTRGGETRFDFAAAFALRAAMPERVNALGLFMRDRPDALVAFVIGFRHGELAEYGVAGSVGDPALRALPFNYWLLWELIGWARGAGARWLDLGGLTDGGPGDPRAGISDFKRHFSELDVETGRELVIDLQPARALAMNVWSEARR